MRMVGRWGMVGEMGSGEAGGTVMCQRPVMKGVAEEGESKNATEVLAKRVCP
jgi:hypothetical protein